MDRAKVRSQVMCAESPPCTISHAGRCSCMSATHRRVALIYDSRLPYDIQVMTGVAAYLQEKPGWSIYIEEKALKDQRLPDLKTWRGDGIIADFDHPTVAKAVQRSHLPAVAFGSGYGWYPPRSPVPYFYTNNDAIAVLAADHMLSRGIRKFAFCGYPRNPTNGWSEERERAFRRYLTKRGFSCSVFNALSDSRWDRLQHQLAAWLVSLPKPVGLMAANDVRGRQVLELCRTQMIRVPESIAVIGVDNDELICQLSSPMLSSVEQGAHRLGYEAAHLLDQMMEVKKKPAKRYIIDPIRIVTRRSSEVLAIDEPKVAEAMALIVQHATKGLQVKDVLSELAISRSNLEARFRQTLGHSIHTAIRRVQMENVRQLVIETSLPLKQISADLSFSSVQHMTTAFSKAFGHSPAKYRQMMASHEKKSSRLLVAPS